MVVDVYIASAFPLIVKITHSLINYNHLLSLYLNKAPVMNIIYLNRLFPNGIYFDRVF